MPRSGQHIGMNRLERLIVTRPAQEAANWVGALQAQGWPAHSLPLIAIAEPEDPATRAALAHWRTHWTQADAIMFVSAAAVQHFFASGVSAPGDGVFHTRFWAPGPGTGRALADALGRLGVDAGRIDTPPADAAQFDSEALWPVVADQVRPGVRVLIVRGLSETPATSAPEEAGAGTIAGSGREWLIRQCEAAGARVEACVAYERRAPAVTGHGLTLVSVAAGPGSVWLFSSSEALAHLCAIQPQPDWSQAAALATHPRIAATARRAGFGRVLESRPSLPDVLHALESNWSRP